MLSDQRGVVGEKPFGLVGLVAERFRFGVVGGDVRLAVFPEVVFGVGHSLGGVGHVLLGVAPVLLIVGIAGLGFVEIGLGGLLAVLGVRHVVVGVGQVVAGIGEFVPVHFGPLDIEGSQRLVVLALRLC